jgi:DNA-binding MarR family transcriptional regulator
MTTVGAGEATAAATGLSTAELTAWRTFLRAHATVVRRLEAELLLEHDLPLASYDVLVQLSEAPDRRLRMTELADRVLLSRSGLTRLADRLERDGLLSRQACPSDARGTLAVLTEAGLARLRAAWPTHLRGVAEHVTGRLSAEEVGQLSTLLGKLVDDGSLPCAGLPGACPDAP